MKSLQFSLCEKSLFLLYFQRIILLDIDFQVDDFFSFNTLKISLHCLLSCMVSDAKSPVILIAVLLYVKCIFLLASFKIFLFVFLQFEYECLNIFVFVFIYPHWYSLDLWFDGIIILENSQPLLLHIFLLFHSLLQYFNYVYVTPFDVVPQFLDALFFSLSFFLFVYISFSDVSINYLQAH